MHSKEQAPSWLTGILKKRTPDAIRILVDLVEAGLRKGQCSPNDIRTDEFVESRVIGSTFKILHNFGFTQLDRRIKPTGARSHGRRVHVWTLDKPELARKLIQYLHGALGETTPTAPHLPGF